MAAAALTRCDDQFPEWAVVVVKKRSRAASMSHAPAFTGFWYLTGGHLAEWQRAGKLRFKEDVLDGIERMPEAFLRLLHGKNFGKQIVRVN
jgi:NADPH-dependent curcumin reductase CurA